MYFHGDKDRNVVEIIDLRR